MNATYRTVYLIDKMITMLKQLAGSISTVLPPLLFMLLLIYLFSSDPAAVGPI